MSHTLAETGSSRRLWFVLLVAAVTAVFFRALFFHAALYIREVGGYALPLRAFYREAILAGRLPEWMPHMQLGMPFLADPGNSVFYPPNVLLFIPWLGWPQAFDVFVFMHVALAAVGAAAACRRLGTSPAAAAVGGLSYGLSGYVLSMTSSFTYLVGPTWAPWVIVAALWNAPAWRRTASIALIVALQVLGGDPQASAVTAAFAIVLALADRRESRRERIARAASISVGALLALGLAAVQLVPATRYVHESVRAAGVPLDIAEQFSLHPVRLADLVAPGATGTTPPDAQYLGRALVDDRHTWPFALSIYLGAAVLALAPLGVRGRLGVPLFALGGVALLLSLGRHAGLYGFLWRGLPLWSMFRYPEKLVAFVTLAAALLVGLGAERAARDRAAARCAWVATVVLLAVALLAWGTAAWQPADAALAAQIARRLAWAAATTACIGGIVRFAGARAGPLLALCIALDLGAHGIRLVDALDPPGQLALPLAAMAERKLAYPPRGFVTAGARTAIERAATVREVERRTAALALPDRELGRVQHLEGHTAAQPATGEALIRALHAHGKRMLDLLGVEWLLQAADDPTSPALEPTGLALAGVSVVRNRDAAPRARMYFHTDASPNQDTALAWIADPRFPADHVAIVEPGGPLLRAMRQAQPCDVLRYEPERVEVACAAPEAALLVLAEQHLSGWRASVDGKPAPLLRANVALRAVALSPGKHTIAFVYATPGLRAGAWISLASLALCAAMLVGSRRR